jgi:demethylmenaquinone methyltransferase/2-methoxy-6-polyprenyl-1,4-benzoquinol methylase
MFDHFGLLAPVYEKFIKPRPPEELIRLLEIPASGRLLDVGGGTGRVSAFLSELMDEVFVVDLSHQMLIQTLPKGDLNPVCSQAEKLPFPDRFFDRVIMVDALHHVCSHSETADELWRVVKSGGMIIIEEPDIRHWGVKIIAWMEKIALMRSHFLDPIEIRDLFPSRKDLVRNHQDGYISRVVIPKP